MLALREPKTFYQAAKELNEHKDDLLEIYIIIGK